MWTVTIIGGGCDIFFDVVVEVGMAVMVPAETGVNGGFGERWSVSRHRSHGGNSGVKITCLLVGLARCEDIVVTAGV